MRKYLLAASAVAAFTAPAYAAANGPYVGIEGGATFPNSTDLDVVVNTRHDDHRPTTTAITAKYKTGYDVDAILGYKLGLFRLEGEAGYKRAKVKKPWRSARR